MSEHDSNSEDDAQMQAILAAFGEDALSMLNDDDDDLSALEASEQLDLSGQASSDEHAREEFSAAGRLSIQCEVPEDASPLVRYMMELNNAIYSRETRDSNARRAPRYIVFAIGHTHFGLPLESVVEIARYPMVTQLPGTPAWLRGITNLRGQIISVTDLRKLLDHESQRPHVGEKIIFVHCAQAMATSGIAVDRVLGLRNFAGQPEPVPNDQRVSQIVSGQTVIDNKPTMLIDPAKLFELADLQPIS